MDVDLFWFGALWTALLMALALMGLAVIVSASDIQDGWRGVRDEWRERQD